MNDVSGRASFAIPRGKRRQGPLEPRQLGGRAPDSHVTRGGHADCPRGKRKGTSSTSRKRGAPPHPPPSYLLQRKSNVPLAQKLERMCLFSTYIHRQSKAGVVFRAV